MLEGWGSRVEKKSQAFDHRLSRSAREQSPQLPVKVCGVKDPGKMFSMGGVWPAGNTILARLPAPMLGSAPLKALRAQLNGGSGRFRGKTISAGSKVDAGRVVTSLDL